MKVAESCKTKDQGELSKELVNPLKILNRAKTWRSLQFRYWSFVACLSFQGWGYVHGHIAMEFYTLQIFQLPPDVCYLFEMGKKHFCCLTELCSLPVLVFSLQHPAPNRESGAGDQSWGICLRSALPLHRHRSHLPFHPWSQRRCDGLNSSLSTELSIKRRTLHGGTSTLTTKYNLLNQL